MIKIVDCIAGALVLIGGLNWGLIGAFDFNLVSYLLGDMTMASRIVYVLIGVSAVLMAYNKCRSCGTCKPKSGA